MLDLEFHVLMLMLVAKEPVNLVPLVKGALKIAQTLVCAGDFGLKCDVLVTCLRY